MKGDLKRGVVLFADLAGSTSLYDTLGNVAASDAVHLALQRMSEVVATFQGEVVKTLGDAVLAWFPNSDTAAGAAISLQKTRARNTLPVRVAFHYGEVIHEVSDIFGDAVNVAARLVATARAGEILTGRETVSHLSDALAAMTRVVSVERLKGKTHAMTVYELLWEDGREVTRAVRHDRGGDPAMEEMCALRLEHGRRQIVVTPRYVPFTFGRDKAASLPVNSDLVSRDHARLEFQNGKFVLVDHSTNGTFVTPHGGAEVQLRRESMPLLGQGVFALGGKCAQNPGVAIRYNFE